MKLRDFSITTILASLTSTAAFPQAKPSSNIPHLEKQGTATQLIVDGKPFLVLGAELNNSSASSMEYMRPLWPKIAATNLNTVLATVSWELMEPEEGPFDFSLVDGLIRCPAVQPAPDPALVRKLEKRQIHLPARVGQDQPAAVSPHPGRKGQGSADLDHAERANRKADARAFAAMMKHIREVDGDAHTVLMMQVENEVGVLGASRDHSPAANKAFAGPVPKEFMDYLQKHKDTLIPELRKRWEAAGFKTSGSWEEVFGAGVDTDEIIHGVELRPLRRPCRGGRQSRISDCRCSSTPGCARNGQAHRDAYPAAIRAAARYPGNGCLEGRRAGDRHFLAGRPRPELRRLVPVVQAIRQPALHSRIQRRRAGRRSRHRHRRQV